MATSYINTGVIGQYLGGSLSTAASVGSQFQGYAEGVKRKKRTVSGPTQEEREAVRQRREERRQQSILDTQLATTDPTTGETVVERRGVEVDTADVKVPEVPARTPQEVAQVAATPPPAPTITKAPLIAKPPPAPSQKVIAPQKQYSESDAAFARTFDIYYQSVQSKNESNVRKGAGALQQQYQSVLAAAQATGNKQYLQIAQAAGAGVAGQKQISSRNVGQAKAATAGARSAIRGMIDLDAILATPATPAPASVVAPAAAPTLTTTSRNRRGWSGLLSTRGRGRR